MKKIYTIENYPADGNHLECDINLPFQIRKGEDEFYYINEKGEEKSYNNYKNKIDDRWIVFLTDEASESLQNIFKIKVSRDLDKIIEYCQNIYKKSIELEIKRLNKELKEIS